MADDLLIPLPDQYETLTLWAEAVSAMLDVHLQESGSQGLLLPILDTQGRTIVDQDGVYAYDEFDLSIPISPNIVQIDTGQLVDAAITTNKIANLAVDTEKLAALSVEAAKLADSSVTSVKIANLAVGSAAIQALAVGTIHIANAAIISALIGDLAVVTGKIDDLAVNEAKIANLAVGSAKIQNAAITNAKIADLAVDTAQIRLAAITSALIGTAQINSAHIEDLTVTDAKIIQLDAGKIVANTITADKYKELRNSIQLTSGDSLDSDFPMVFDFVVSSEVTAIQSVKLSFKVLPYRGYSSGDVADATLVTNLAPSRLHRHDIDVEVFEPTLIRSAFLGWFIGYFMGNWAQLVTDFSNGAIAYRQDQTNSAPEAFLRTTIDPIDGHTHDLKIPQYDQFVAVDTIHMTTPGFTDPDNALSILIAYGWGGQMITEPAADGHAHTLTIHNSDNSGLNLAEVYFGNFTGWDVEKQAFITGSKLGVRSDRTLAGVDEKLHISTDFGVTGHRHETPAHAHDILFDIQEEQNNAFVSVAIDNGAGFGPVIKVTNSDQLELDITNHISGTGFKAIKFKADKRCRVQAFIEMKVDLTA